MKTQRMLILAAILMMLALTACESGGKFQVINRTSFPLFVTIDSFAEQAIPAGATHTFEIDTDSQTFLTGEVSQTVKVKIYGDTYQIYDQNNNAFVDSTQTVIKAGMTTRAFIDPNRASVRIINSSSQTIESIEVYRHNYISPARIATLTDLVPGQMRNVHVNYSIPVDSSASEWIPTPATNYYYYAVLRLADNQEFIYGNANTILYKDQQLLVVFTDPDNN